MCLKILKLIQEVNEKTSYDSDGRSFSNIQRYVILIEKEKLNGIL